MKKCCKCGLFKEEIDFLKEKNRISSRCIECNKEYCREYYKAAGKEKILLRNKERRKYLRDEINKLKDKPCVDCGDRFPSCAMDFDHKHSKILKISEMVNLGWGIKKLLEEISKCDLVCSNCHRIRTFNRLQEKKN